jgi:hypothetical protein
MPYRVSEHLLDIFADVPVDTFGTTTFDFSASVQIVCQLLLVEKAPYFELCRSDFFFPF